MKVSEMFRHGGCGHLSRMEECGWTLNLLGCSANRSSCFHDGKRSTEQSYSNREGESMCFNYRLGWAGRLSLVGGPRAATER